MENKSSQDTATHEILHSADSFYSVPLATLRDFRKLLNELKNRFGKAVVELESALQSQFKGRIKSGRGANKELVHHVIPKIENAISGVNLIIQATVFAIKGRTNYIQKLYEVAAYDCMLSAVFYVQTGEIENQHMYEKNYRDMHNNIIQILGLCNKNNLEEHDKVKETYNKLINILKRKNTGGSYTNDIALLEMAWDKANKRDN